MEKIIFAEIDEEYPEEIHVYVHVAIKHIVLIPNACTGIL